MSDLKVKAYIKDLFATMNAEVSKIVVDSLSPEKAAEDIIGYVSSKLAAKSRGYLSTIYSTLSDETLQEPVFQDAGHANQFFNLNLDLKIIDAYQFDVKELPRLYDGINFKEINRVYASAAAGVGTTAVGGVLLGVLSGLVTLPVISILAGAVVSGLVGYGVTYVKAVPGINKRRFLDAAAVFMNDLESEMYRWVDGVVDFYHAQIAELKKTF